MSFLIWKWDTDTAFFAPVCIFSPALEQPQLQCAALATRGEGVKDAPPPPGLVAMVRLRTSIDRGHAFLFHQYNLLLQRWLLFSIMVILFGDLKIFENRVIKFPHCSTWLYWTIPGKPRQAIQTHGGPEIIQCNVTFVVHLFCPGFKSAWTWKMSIN